MFITELDYFDRITENTKPHPVFRTDWTSYYETNFADTFLPLVETLQKDALFMADGAELFEYRKLTDRLVYDLWIKDELIDLWVYSYSELALVAKNKHRLPVNERAVIVFLEVTKTNQVNVDIRFGRNLTKFIANLAAKNKALFNGKTPVYTQAMSITDFKQKTSSVKSHKHLLDAIFDLTGIDTKIVAKQAQLDNLQTISEKRNTKRKKKKVLDEAGGHVIDSKGNVIWSSKNNPDNGYTWRYVGAEVITNLSNDEIIKLKGIELVTVGSIDDDEKTVMNFVENGADAKLFNLESPAQTINTILEESAGHKKKTNNPEASFQKFIRQQADIMGVPSALIMLPDSRRKNIAYVQEAYHGTTKRAFYNDEPTGWPNNEDMGSIVLKEKKDIVYCWNSRFGNKIRLANIYDIRATFAHENDHFRTQHRFFDEVLPANMKAYAKEQKIEYASEEDMIEKVTQRANTKGHWDDKIATIWFFQIDANYFMPTAMYSDPFMELKAYDSHVNYKDFDKVSVQMKVHLLNVIFLNKKMPNESGQVETPHLIYAMEQGYGKALYGGPDGLITDLTKSDNGLIFWNHKTMEGYKNFIKERYKPLLDFAISAKTPINVDELVDPNNVQKIE